MVISHPPHLQPSHDSRIISPTERRQFLHADHRRYPHKRHHLARLLGRCHHKWRLCPAIAHALTDHHLIWLKQRRWPRWRRRSWWWRTPWWMVIDASPPISLQPPPQPVPGATRPRVDIIHDHPSSTSTGGDASPRRHHPRPNHKPIGSATIHPHLLWAHFLIIPHAAQ